jgi:hypothetical protein
VAKKKRMICQKEKKPKLKPRGAEERLSLLASPSLALFVSSPTRDDERRAMQLFQIRSFVRVRPPPNADVFFVCCFVGPQLSHCHCGLRESGRARACVCVLGRWGFAYYLGISLRGGHVCSAIEQSLYPPPVLVRARGAWCDATQTPKPKLGGKKGEIK